MKKGFLFFILILIVGFIPEILLSAVTMKITNISSDRTNYCDIVYLFKVEALNADGSIDTNCFYNVKIYSSNQDDIELVDGSSLCGGDKLFTLNKGVYQFGIIGKRPEDITLYTKVYSGETIKDDSYTINFRAYNTGNVIINEIMYRYRDNEREWIELYNKSGNDINLQNWVLKKIDPKSSGSTTNSITLPSLIIKKNSYMVLTEDNSYFKNDFPYIDTSYYNSTSLLTSKFFSTTKGIVQLFDNNGNIVDIMFYNNDDYDLDYMQSLERVNPDFPSYDENNWAGCISTEGIDRGVKGTPGEANSVYKESENNSDIEIKASISLDKKVYDVSSSSLFNINFSINLPVKVDVKIFDSRGNEVRRIKNEYQIGQGNITFKFDGYNSEGKKLTTGLYFIYITYINDKTGHYGKVIKPFIISNGKF